MKRITLALCLTLLVSVVTLDRLASRGAQGSASQASSVVTSAPRPTAIDVDGYSFVGGNPNGDVTVVEFFDYRCGYCRSVRADLMQLLDEDSDIRLVLKEYPVLSKSSFAIAKIAMAALRQGGQHYWSLHNALLAEGRQLSEDRAIEIAKDIGLDMERLRRDMADPKLAADLARTRDEGRRLNANGTPTFVIGGKVYVGAISNAQMQSAVRGARERQQSERGT
jgi:protein-disulfide isomerase